MCVEVSRGEQLGLQEKARPKPVSWFEEENFEWLAFSMSRWMVWVIVKVREMGQIWGRNC